MITSNPSSIEQLLEERKNEVLYHPGGERWCTVKGKDLPWVPSVTTFLGTVLNKGIGFETWLGNAVSYKDACRDRDEAATRGTLVHNLCEQLMINKRLDVSDEILAEYGEKVTKRLMQFEAWYNSNKPEVCTTEYKLYHESLPFSGTPDIVCDMGDGLSIIDIKTGAPYQSHQLQLSCYKMLWDANFPEYPIKNLYGLYLKDSWISKVEPLVKAYKHVPKTVDDVYNVWKWMVNDKLIPKTKKPVKTSFSLFGNILESALISEDNL